MHSYVPIFRAGEMILVGKDTAQLRACIINFRSLKREPKSYQKSYGCDVITEQLNVRWYALDDIVKWNPHKVREWFE